MVSRNPTGRNRWDQLVWALNEVLEVDPILQDPARSSMTGDQAEVLYGTLAALAHATGNVRVIREQQSSKSRLVKIERMTP
jgi:hypothetical protein